jgi:hypothetical protein
MVAGGLVCVMITASNRSRARYAMDDFFTERPEQTVPLPIGNGFVLIEPPRSVGLDKA